MDIKKHKIEQVFSEIKLLEERVLSIRTSENTPFSFFYDSYEKLYVISKLLREIEYSQIEELKGQMAKLLTLVSEVKIQKEPQQTSPPQTITANDTMQARREETKEQHPEMEEEKPSVGVVAQDVEKEVSILRNSYAEGLTLPVYSNPKKTETRAEEPIFPTTDAPVKKSLNDNIQTPPSQLDVKRSLSLNDRFYFQRELFDNNREAMNAIMLQLHAFDNFSAAEKYLLQTTGWNFEDETVKNFLDTLRKGFY